ncbi:MAG TPA: hypothetical protein PKO06_04425 [Candidatus Ozemobacteraceae bacterium]|nr:hypothetical protein [Candidatus Ozemobacteraceae bacterium]
MQKAIVRVTIRNIMAPPLSSKHIEHLVFDLSSSERNVRLAAIFQLGTQLATEEVRQALTEHAQQESDPEVAFYLEQALARGSDTGPQVDKAPTSTTEIPDLRTLPPERYRELLPPVRRLPPEQRVAKIEELLSLNCSSHLAEALLGLGQEFPFRALTDTHFRRLLFHANPGTSVRVLYLAGRHAPERVLAHVPDLLQRPSLLTRALALRLLHRYLPDQALRLLEEFLDHPEPAQRGIGVGLLFQFPFEEVAGAVLRLLESGHLPGHSHEMIVTLIRSNPNAGFARRLAYLATNHPDQAELQTLAEAAADALILSGLEAGPLPVLSRRLREAAEQEAMTALTLPASPDAAPVASAAAPPPVTAATTAPPSATAGTELTALSLENLTSAPQVLAALLPLAERRERANELTLPAFAALQKHGVSDSRFHDWGESLLEHSPEALLVQVIRYLERQAPRRLVSHLPLLAFHESPFVASQAVRILRRQEGSAFLKRLDVWLKDPDPRALRAGLAGLLQMDFNRVRPLVIRHLRTNPRQEALEGIGRMIRMNPDHRLIAELHTLAAATSTAKRREFLEHLARDCRAELQRLYGATGEPTALHHLRELWADQVEVRLNDLLTRLQSVHLSASESLQEDPGRWLRGIALLIGIVALLLASSLSESPFPTVPASSSSTGKPVVIKRATEQARLSSTVPIIGTLEAYDPLTRTWKFRTADGGLHKVRFSEPSRRLEPGKRISGTVHFLETTPLGYNLYLVHQYQLL